VHAKVHSALQRVHKDTALELVRTELCTLVPVSSLLFDLDEFLEEAVRVANAEDWLRGRDAARLLRAALHQLRAARELNAERIGELRGATKSRHHREAIARRVPLGASAAIPHSARPANAAARALHSHGLCPRLAHGAVARYIGGARSRFGAPTARLPPARGGGRPATAPQLARGGVPGEHPPRHELRLRSADGTAFAHLRHEVGQWRGGETAMRLAATGPTALESSTARAYNRHWLAFCAWCDAQGLDPMPATPRMVFAYVGFLAERGTVAADSLQPYLSAINAAHADYGYDKPALGHLVARARQGMRRAQALAATRDTRVPLPAAAVLRVLRHACASAAAWRSCLSATACAQLLRGAYAVCLSFLFFGRQDSCVALSVRDHGIQPDAIWLRLTEKMRRAAALRRVVVLPLRAPPVRGHPSLLPEVAALGRLYADAVQRLGAASAVSAQRTHLFQLPGEAPPRTADMSSWLQTQLQMVAVQAPVGFSYLGHSIRSGASSAAEAIGVSRFLGNWMGGWSQTGRTRELHYMDPSVRPCPAAFGFFGWMLDGRFEALPPTWEYRVGARPNDEPGEPA